MDFTKAVKADTTEARDELIRQEVYSEFWPNRMDDHLKHGGFVDDHSVESVSINDDGETLEVEAVIQFTEAIPTSCQNINHEYDPTSATFRILIDRATGRHEVESSEPYRRNDEYY